MKSTIGDIYRYRELLKYLVWTNLVLRYRRSYLGFLWQILNPLFLMAILAIVFGSLLRIRVERFPVFLLAGLLPWTLFNQGALAGLISIVQNESLLKKVYVPKILLPLAAVLSQLVDTAMSLLPLLLIALLFDTKLGPSLLVVPLALGLTAVATVGIALLLAAAFVFVRDVNHFAALALQGWFYMCPIIYPPEMLPEGYRWIVWANPMTYLIECFRQPFYQGQVPSLETWLLACLSAFGFLLAGLVVFRVKEPAFIHNLS